uniref:Protein-tyrosine-phosphatase n=3 Tax=Proconiini TaxID=565685 RepID=A0A1B6GL34_9HEMI
MSQWGTWAVVGWLALVLASARSDGNVGCLFSPSLCIPEVEWCFNDDAFGRCLQENVDEEDLYRHELSPDELQELEREMERLLNLGYRWSHSYTQCLLQAMLYAYKIRMVYDPEVCNNLKDQDLASALKAFESDEMALDPQNVAFVKFTPSANNPHAEFADEVYFPPLPLDADFLPVPPPVDRDEEDIDEEEEEQPLPLREVPVVLEPQEEESDYPGVGFSQRQFPFSLVRKKSLPHRRSLHFSTNYNTPDDFRRGYESRDLLPDGVQEMSAFSEVYNTPDGFRSGDETRDQHRLSEPLVLLESEESNQVDPAESILLPMLKAIGESYPSPRVQEGQEREGGRLLELSGRMADGEGEVARGYTEGGMVLIPDKHTDADQSLSEFLVGLNSDNWGFKRPERLDVKKPGPPFKTNNYAFKTQTEEKSQSSKGGSDHKEKTSHDHDDCTGAKETERHPESAVQPEPDILPQVQLQNVEKLIAVPPQKKTYGPDLDMTGSQQYDIINNNFAFIEFKEIINTWQQGERIIEEVAKQLHVPKSTFDEIRVDRNEVTFRVLNNNKNLNASTVAKKIEDIKYDLKQKCGVTVTSAGIGDKTKLPSVLSLNGDGDFEFFAVAFIVSVIFITVVLSTILLLLVRRYVASRAKIRNLTTPDTEASKDYQELCRARMAAKPPHDTAAPTAASHRIASLSRESDNSPSSRSSTSSWSEEPALSSMDISTGHMVLSYMEDHLRNKDRLETEWAALCAYEAEPCATIIAQRPENAKKNRYVNALPYDHARVVLNELSNISGSDYINASTITDHDPRNPAYIATQGPLPHTAPDLWQMVWEQGCVVMVMLTRLIENDVSMCHRYWPEEGSELYHIYEVHLVSEHFWCDDYLVRSFYLKNLKTTETRTVTQFHFLSWPEGGVPVSTKALLEFRRKVNKSFRGRSCPIAVHCSDGVGRTGTYCLLDMVLNRMAKGAKEIDIAATLEHIRDQRGGSVATKQQFQFVLAAVAEEVQATLRNMSQQKAEPPPATPPTTTQPPAQ